MACLRDTVQVGLHHPFAAENLAALALKITRAQYEPLASSVGLKQAAAEDGAAAGGSCGIRRRNRTGDKRREARRLPRHERRAAAHRAYATGPHAHARGCAPGPAGRRTNKSTHIGIGNAYTCTCVLARADPPRSGVHRPPPGGGAKRNGCESAGADHRERGGIND